MLKHSSESYIIELENASGQMVRTTAAVMQTMVDYYEGLYPTWLTTDMGDLTAYFDTIALLWLDDSHWLYLDVPFTRRTLLRLSVACPAAKPQALMG